MEKRIPAEAYRYWPKGEDVYIGEGKKIMRLIFYKTEFTRFELDQLQTFKSKIPVSTESNLSEMNLPDEELLRILVSTSFDQKEALKCLTNLVQFPDTPKESVSSDLLEEGSIYLHGIDSKYRPLIVINIGRMNLKQRTAKTYCDLLCFLLNHAIVHHMIPGQIENWVIITDLCSISTSNLPIKDIKDIIKVLQSNYRCRMAVNYIVNAPSGIKLVWAMLSRFLNASTVRKVKISRGVTDEIKLQFAENQLETKYGGTAGEVCVFWPPQMPQAPYSRIGEPPLSNISTFELYNHVPSKHNTEVLPSDTREIEGLLNDLQQVQDPSVECTPPEVSQHELEEPISLVNESLQSLRKPKKNVRVVSRKLVYLEDGEYFEYADILNKEKFPPSNHRRPNSISCCWFWKRK